MNTRQTISGFAMYDLIFFSILAAISDAMSYALLDIFHSDFYFSFAIALCLIAMLRWGIAGIIVGIIGGIPSLIYSDMVPGAGILYHILANMALVVPILLYETFGGGRSRNKISGQSGCLMLYILLSHLCLSAGKGVVIFFLTGRRQGWLITSELLVLFW